MGMKLWYGIGLLASIAAGAGSAAAADLAVRPPPPGLAPAYLSDWAGFYIGINGGGGWASTTFDFSPELNAKPSGGVFGGHAGYNWQYGSVVTGLELDFSGADIKTSGVVGTFWDYCREAYGDISRSVKFDELATARARLGYVVLPNLLAYGTAGAAWGHSEMTGSVQYFGSGTAGTNNFGWVAGGGLEHKAVGAYPGACRVSVLRLRQDHVRHSRLHHHRRDLARCRPRRPELQVLTQTAPGLEKPGRRAGLFCCQQPVCRAAAPNGAKCFRTWQRSTRNLALNDGGPASPSWRQASWLTSQSLWSARYLGSCRHRTDQDQPDRHTPLRSGGRQPASPVCRFCDKSVLSSTLSVSKRQHAEKIDEMLC